MDLIVLGIDPGARSAAYGVVNGMNAFADDVPVVDNMVNAVDFHRRVKAIKPDVAVIERVGAMPHQGLTSTFRFGLGTGLLRGIVQGLGIRLIEVTPAEWKRYYKLDNDKEKARARAISLFPNAKGLNRKKDAGRAEALLIANWYIEYGARRDSELV